MVEAPDIEVIQPDWPAPPNVRAFTTTRNGGFSQGSWSSLNLGANCGDDPQHVENNRHSLLRLLPSEPRWLNQVHGTNVVGWDEVRNAGTEADAIISNQAGQVCAVLTADCLPVFFCNKAGTQVAAVHAGWRGLAGGVLGATVAAMNCNPNDLIGWLGPAIGPSVFEVGQDVYDAFTQTNRENICAFKTKGERWLADLYLLARLELAKVGVQSVFGGKFCVYTDHLRFFSYRRDNLTGRMASMIWLES
jgi:YfiH family protein